MSDRPETLDEIHIALRKMLADKQISEGEYFKGLLRVAQGWTEVGRVDNAVSLVGELTAEYLAVALPSQMRDDPEFARVAADVSRAVSSGLPDVDDDDVTVALMLLQTPKAKA